MPMCVGRDDEPLSCVRDRVMRSCGVAYDAAEECEDTQVCLS